jgi:tetratricopeptide (TPR) repeat protein
MSIANTLIRSRLLFHQSRYAEAEQELRRALGEAPHDVEAHSLLALCLVRQDELNEAQQEAEQAIVLEPDWAFPHHCRSVVLEHRKRFAEAEVSAREAVRLEPLDPDYHAGLASILFQQRKWQQTLDAAMEGLSHDAEHEACNHLRSMALTKLGRPQEAVESVDAALARDPDDAMAHTNKGWALLHQGKPREALEHFREALRIDPTFEYAQQGIVEALKARNPLYRWMLAYFLWMARLSNGARWGVIIGGYIGARFLNTIARNNPAVAPWILPLILLYLVFVLLTWFAYPLFNLLLRCNKYGWYALSRDQRTASNWFGTCLAIFVVAMVAAIGWNASLAFLIAGFAVGMALPLVTIYQCDVGWPRQAMMTFASAMAGVGLTAIAFTALGNESGTMFVAIFVLGFIATPWLANYLMMATARR